MCWILTKDFTAISLTPCSNTRQQWSWVLDPLPLTSGLFDFSKSSFVHFLVSTQLFCLILLKATICPEVLLYSEIIKLYIYIYTHTRISVFIPASCFL